LNPNLDAPILKETVWKQALFMAYIWRVKLPIAWVAFLLVKTSFTNNRFVSMKPKY